MLKINKITSECAVDYAAEELKKYLRMMMPECGDIKISYDPAATDGFRLGLMQDFGLDVSDAEDPVLDDILYIKCNTGGGIIAGDNPRSVLLAVYEYLRQNGCRWLFPGVDGEFIPMKNIVDVEYRHVPSMRYRGWCNEGAEYQQSMYEAIDFVPKVGMNTFMMEFRIPVPYYNSYYSHSQNTENRQPEPLSQTTVLQWKRACETEVAKRGLQYHDIGHGWTADPFGLDSSLREWMGDNEVYVTDEIRPFLAMMNGERKLYRNRPNFTNFCMSNPVAQQKFAKYVAEYAENHSNSTFLHVWLADLSSNHCECEACRKKTPSDWYVDLLNLVDDELTARKLDTRIVFISYVDTAWAPVSSRIKNEKRFSMLFAPITRKYTETLPAEPTGYVTEPYELNKSKMPATLEQYFAHLKDWQRIWRGKGLAYEYHFWHHQCYDLGGFEFSKRINEDVRTYKQYGIDGIIEDGSQRSFFPTGLLFYTYARSLYDVSLSAEQIAKEYFDAAFGEAADKFANYLRRVGDAFGFYYLEQKESENPDISSLYSPKRAEILRSFPAIAAEGRALIDEYYNSDTRVGTRSVRLLEYHLEFCTALAEIFAHKALGEDEPAKEKFEKLRIEFGKHEAEIQTNFDHYQYFYYLSQKVNIKSNTDATIIASEGQ